jgi:hypothetical protein
MAHHQAESSFLDEVSKAGCSITKLHMLVFEKKVNVNCLHVPLNETALIKAAERGNAEIVQWLLSEGKADVTLVDTKHQTALHFAALKDHVDVATLLVNHPGTDINARERSHSYTPLLVALAHKAPKVAKLLVQQNGTDMDVVDRCGRSAVFLAVQYQAWDSLKVLLDAGAKLDIPTNADEGGKTALHEACEKVPPPSPPPRCPSQCRPH